MPDGGALFLAEFARLVKPRQPLTIDAWADAHRRVSAESSGEPGPWRTDRVPFAREIMQEISPQSLTEEVVLMASAQITKTEILLNAVGHCIDQDPCPMLVVYPTLETAELWSKQRLTPMIRDTPVLAEKIPPARSRDSGNNTLLKLFPGGLVRMAGANSPASLSQMPVKKALFDEVDRYPESAGEEGDPVALGEARTQNFRRRKLVYASTPTIESLSRIAKRYKASDQRHYYVPCPHCNTHQVLDWDRFKWDEGKPDTAHFVCEAHGCIIDEAHKPNMLAAGQWRKHNPGSRIAGFWIWAAYSPIGLGLRWAEIARKFEEVKADPERRKVFDNTVRGVCFADPNEKLDWEVIKSRAEAYPLRTVPAGCLILTAGVDVQGNRLAVQIVGWGANGQFWPGIDWVELPGDPTKPEVWQALDDLLQRPLVNRFGVSLKISATAVDSGYLPDDVLRFTRPRGHRNVYAVKGSSVPGRTAVSAPQQQDRKASGKQMKRGAKAWSVGTDTIKAWLFLLLQDDGKYAHAHERRAHFSDQLPVEYFTQLCAEVFDPHKRKWVKQQARNEALDTLVYARWAAMSPKLRLHLMREPDWARFAAVIEPINGDLFAPPPETAPTAADAAPDQPKPADPAPVSHETSPRKPRIIRRSNWVTGFKK